jgi:hypothetical protein
VERQKKLDQRLVFTKFSLTYYRKFIYFIVYLSLGIRVYEVRGGSWLHCLYQSILKFIETTPSFKIIGHAILFRDKYIK